mmetsp:Transcript_37040/g.50118  ORF Transcript_37040/g.50118 Transcript_37040/m.50118 type:complete len:86 (+) Transcript_37040:91-348(+)
MEEHPLGRVVITGGSREFLRQGLASNNHSLVVEDQLVHIGLRWVAMTQLQTPPPPVPPSTDEPEINPLGQMTYEENSARPVTPET